MVETPKKFLHASSPTYRLQRAITDLTIDAFVPNRRTHDKTHTHTSAPHRQARTWRLAEYSQPTAAQSEAK